jgi:hypothetical protein
MKITYSGKRITKLIRQGFNVDNVFRIRVRQQRVTKLKITPIVFSSRFVVVDKSDEDILHTLSFTFACPCKLTKCQVCKMPSWQNAKLTNARLSKYQVNKMKSWQNAKLIKCPDDKMPSWQNAKLTKCQVNKMPSYKLLIWKIANLTKCQVNKMPN